MNKPLEILKTTINIGLKKPIKILHITDTHMTIDDEGYSSGRRAVFEKEYDGCSEDYFFQALDYAKKNDMIVLHTGDIIDYFSKGNFDFIDKYLSDPQILFAAGNHDFVRLDIPWGTEDDDYKWGVMKTIAPHFNCNLLFDSKIIGGVNFVMLDNTYYQITEGQIAMLKAEVAKGLPIILCVHVPFYTKNLYDESMRLLNNWCASLIAVPDEKMEHYTGKDRIAQQKANATTLKAVDYIKNEPLIKGIIAGHLHLNFEDDLTSNLKQIITHGSFAGYVREITIN